MHLRALQAYQDVDRYRDRDTRGAPSPTGRRYPSRMAPPEHAAGRVAAFFDLDKTIVAKSSALAFSRELYREGFISPATVARTTYAQLSFQLFGADADRMDRSREAVLELMRGWDAGRIRELVGETLDEVIEPIVYPEARELLDWHRDAGHRRYIVSSAGVEILEPLGERLGVDRVIATRMGIDDEGRYDGTLEFYCYAEAKAEAILREAEEQGLDLGESWAYSDSITDLPLLEAVGHPVAVNPDRELRAIAVERGWPIREFATPEAARAPRPSGEVLAGAGALSALAVAGWWVYHQRQRGGPFDVASEWDWLPLAHLANRRAALRRLTHEGLERLATMGRKR